ncbi:hypothetical protein KPH14_001529 [Odynerus spinipes]|uniref:Phosphatidic acid phosphatase type 2/haloperoxidase domain-containing protein n=1 Tax=Odynerus spinipes TaxID=1348599 RepID=A0AAD9RUY2_9HYME|nr:hypothetical protein KPH14_001529 [Odynerus spinipes]
MQRSTEQLTRCSTVSLEEETTDKTDNAVSAQTIPKIMSVCRNTIRWVLLFDVLLALTVIALMGLMEFGNLPRNQIGFFCNDPKLSFKFTGDTISITVLLGVSIFMPIIMMWVTEYACHAADSYTTESGSRGSRLKQVWFWYGHYAIGIAALTVGCNVMKIVIGEPRPHFFDTCRPQEARNCTDEYIDSYTCTNTIDSNWFVSDSSKSFPSSHSALSMFTTIFVVCYLQQRMTSRTILFKPWLQFTVCMWTVICSFSRIGDNRHHWWDVLVGMVLGLISAVLVVSISCQEFRFDGKKALRMRREFIRASEPIAFDDKSYQSVKKLVNNANNVDIPEGRELRDITVSWKE